MPAKSVVWILFETRPDPHNLHKPLKYKSDKSHSAAWCSGCTDRFVEVQAASDALNLSQGSLSQDEVRTADHLRDIAKNADLECYSANWKADHNIYGTTGVIPIAGKVDTMLAHARQCMYTNNEKRTWVEHQLAVVAEAKARAKAAQLQANLENTPPTITPPMWTPPSAAGNGSSAPYAIYHVPTVPTTPTPTPFLPLQPSTSPIPQPPFPQLRYSQSEPIILPSRTPSTDSTSHPSDADCHGTPCSERSSCRCKCHTPWDENRQRLFEADLCDLFVACNFSFNAAENPQTHIFFKKWVPGAEVPDRRKLSGSCLDAAVKTAMAETRTAVLGQYATGQSDGWKNVAKTSVLTSTMNVNWRAHLVRTHDMTGRPKTGQEHLEVIKSDMAYMETTYGVTTVAWVTDDGPDGKGARSLLRKLAPWLILLVCWAHQCNLLVGDYLVLDPYRKIMSRAIEVAKWFNSHSAALDLLNSEQLTTYEARTRPLTLLLPVITRWTAHLHAAVRVLDVERALVFVVAKHKQRLTAIAESSRSNESQSLAVRVIATIEDGDFWTTLRRVVAHLKPLGIATNILQSSHARLDHVLFTLANLYHTYSATEVELDVREHMLSKLEVRWKKNADQDLFILAGLLNPYVRDGCFNREALSRQDLVNIAVRVFTRLFRCAPVASFSDAVEEYLDWKGDYTDEAMKLSTHLKNAGDKEVDLLRIWKLMDRSNDNMKAVRTDKHGLPRLAYRVLSVAVNTGDTERVFSDFGVTHTRRRNRLSPETVHKVSVVRKSLRRGHATSGLLTTRLKRKLAPGSYEPSQSPTPVLGGHTTTNEPRATRDSESETDGPLEFEDLGDVLVKSAIDSRAHMEAESEDEEEEGEEETQGGSSSSGPSLRTIRPDTVRARAQPEPRSRKKKPSKASIRLADLFLYPRAPPGYDGFSVAEKQVFDASEDGDRLRCLRFIWKTGEVQYINEQRLTETLQRDGRTEA